MTTQWTHRVIESYECFGIGCKLTVGSNYRHLKLITRMELTTVNRMRHCGNCSLVFFVTSITVHQHWNLLILLEE